MSVLVVQHASLVAMHTITITGMFVGMVLLPGWSETKDVCCTHRLHGSSFWGLPYRVLDLNHKMELLWSLWVGLNRK